MEASSPSSNGQALPDGVDPDDLYDGPNAADAPVMSGHFTIPPQALAAPIPPVPVLPPAPSHVSATQQVKSEYPAVIMVALDVLAARLLALVALVTACLIWGGVVVDPNMWRIIAASAFSVSVFAPTAALYWKAGMTGERGT